MALTVMQLLPALNVGGVERGTLEIADALVRSGHRAIVVSAGGRLVGELEHLGAEHIVCPIGAKSLRSLALIRPLRALMSDHKVDIVHARSRLPAWLGYRALQGIAPQTRPHWVTTVHGPYSVNAYSRIMTTGERVVAISEFIGEYIRRHYPKVDHQLIRTIPRGVDTAVYPYGFEPSASWLSQWRAEHSELNNKHLLVAPGRLTRWKGLEDFIDMIATLVADGENVHGLVAGGSDVKTRAFDREMREKVQQKRLSSHVTFLGHRDDLREVLSIADIAYSLTFDPEAFGRTTIEALSLGTPVIGYNHGGTGEILSRLYPIGLASPRDIGAVVAATKTILRQPISVPTNHGYTVARMQSATLAVYSELAN